MVRIEPTDIAWGVTEVTARGRNGWFGPERIHVAPSGLAVFSRQNAQVPPIVLKLGSVDMERLGLAILGLPSDCELAKAFVVEAGRDHTNNCEVCNA